MSNLPTRKSSELSTSRSYVFYGQAGTGKTTLAGTFPKPCLLIDCRDKGSDSVSDQDVDVYEVEEWADLERAYWFLKKNPDKYKTVVIDTMSQLQGIAIEQILDEKGKRGSADDIGWGTMTQQEWGAVASMMKPKITEFRDLPMDVVFIAQHRVFNVAVDEEDDPKTALLAPEVGPQLMPSVAKHLNASVAIIGNTFIRTRTEEKVVKKTIGRGKRAKTREEVQEIEHIEYCLRIGPNPLYTTKMRKSKSIKVPDMIVDPDYTKIMDVLKGEA